jgi:hypothetical protein
MRKQRKKLHKLSGGPTPLPHEKCRIYVTTDRGHTKTKISSQLAKTGEASVYRSRIRKYWTKKLNVNNYNAHKKID